MEPKIIFEDDEILVLDKPAGMTVNRADTTKDEVTVQDRVEGYLQIPKDKLSSQAASTEPASPSASDRSSRDGSLGGRGEKITNKSQVQNSNYQNNNDKSYFEPGNSEVEFLSRAGIVHRIDKETSGILIVAKTLLAFINLQLQFKERKVKKTYIALVHGKVEGDGEINVPVGRLPWNRTHFGVLAGGKEALSKYHVLSIMYHVSGGKKDPLSLFEVYPETGRTHQIRVHLKYIGHPIFGDQLYAGRKTARKDRKHLSRFFLHASKISFFHPKTNKLVSFESDLPSDLKTLLDKLEK